ncbi:hypothetical protein [Chryseolinea soli]|nr:hypothetical protein [Chryseolinea soli]
MIQEKIKNTKSLFIAALFVLTLQSVSYGQRSFESPDSLILCLHKVLSGPAGARNWELYRSLFHEKAILGVVRIDAQGHPSYSSSTPEEYIKRTDEFFRTNDFYVEETHRITERFGDIMSLFSTYKFRAGGGVKAQQNGKGINSFQLIHDAGRWWIISIQYTNERADLPMPKQYEGVDMK